MECSPQKQNGWTFWLTFIKIFRQGFFFFNVYFIQTKVLLLYFNIFKRSWLSLSVSLSPFNRWMYSSLAYCLKNVYNKTIIEFGFCMISWIIKSSYLPQPSASAHNTNLGFDNSWYHAQPHSRTVSYMLYITHLLVSITEHPNHYKFAKFKMVSSFLFHLCKEQEYTSHKDCSLVIQLTL